MAWILLSALACGRGETAQQGGGTVATSPKPAFDGAKAMTYVQAQMAFGPRVPGTEAHRKAGDWLVAEMRQRADTVIVQEWTHTTVDGKQLPMRNVFARINPAATQRILYLAHWDSRPKAEKSRMAGDRVLPTPGANDGASGVALLMAVADELKKQPATVGVDLLFVDGEDWGDFGGPFQDVLIGSQYFAANMPSDYRPLFGVLFDMIGDRDLKIPIEDISVQKAPEVVKLVWDAAASIGHANVFTQDNQGAITDDHVPFLNKGLRVIDVIDINYEWHHTVEDLADKVSVKSLQVVGEVAMQLIRTR